MSDKEPKLVITTKLKPKFYIKKFIILMLRSDKLADAFVKDFKEYPADYISIKHKLK